MAFLRAINVRALLLSVGVSVLVAFTVGVALAIATASVAAASGPGLSQLVSTDLTPTDQVTVPQSAVSATSVTGTSTATAPTTPTSTSVNTTPTSVLTSTPSATSTAAPACAPHFDIVATPPDSGSNSALRGVSALASNDVWAVGGYLNSQSNVDQTLIEHWDGQVWSVVPSPNNGSTTNFLTAVSGLTSNDVWAVGYYSVGSGDFALIEHWDGTQWSIVTNPGNDILYGVSAVAANDVWAVGSYSGLGLIEHWDGAQWSIVAGSRNAYLRSVSVVSANDVWAVGTALDQAFIEHWDGQQWSTVPSPSASDLTGLNGVSAVGANDVWAIGYATSRMHGFPHAIIEHWDGQKWSFVSSPDIEIASLISISALAANDVWVVGAVCDIYGGTNFSCGTLYRTLVEHWDGQGWSVIPSPNSGLGDSSLYAVSALASNDVWAVGVHSMGSTLAERYSSACQATCTVTFSDVPDDSAFYPFIRCLACRNIVSGYNDGAFRPSNSVTRGEAAKMVSNAAGSDDPIPQTRQTFSDVPFTGSGSTFWVNIERLVAYKLVNRYADNTFRPSQPITRGQLAKIDSNAAGFREDPLFGNQSFEDVLPADPFYPYIERLSLHGVITGYKCGTPPAGSCDAKNRPYYLPNSLITRGQAAKVVSNTFFPGGCTLGRLSAKP